MTLPDGELAEITGRADALLSGLNVGRMPDGKHFNSDIGAVIAFAKWYARKERERLAAQQRTRHDPRTD